MGNTVLHHQQPETALQEIESTNALERAMGDRGFGYQGSNDLKAESDFEDYEDEDQIHTFTSNHCY